jgi:site-specific recombinase XerD
MSKLPFASIVQQYLAELQLRNLSPRTIQMYGDVLQSFIKHLTAGQTEQVVRLAQVTPEAARAYATARMQASTRYPSHPFRGAQPGALSLHTIDREIRALKTLGNWMQANDYGNPFAALKRPKLPKHLIHILSPEEITQLNLAHNPETHFGARWQAMLAFFLDTGVRLSELAELRLDNLDLRNFRAKVRGKGNKERYVRFGARTHRLLNRYLHLFRPKTEAEQFFLDLRGRALTANNIAHIVSTVRQKAAVPRVHCHLFRHTFATQFLLDGGNVFELQALLGHESLEITQQYVHLAEQMARTGGAAHQRPSVLDAMEKAGARFDRPAKGRRITQSQPALDREAR